MAHISGHISDESIGDSNVMVLILKLSIFSSGTLSLMFEKSIGTSDCVTGDLTMPMVPPV